MKTLIIFLTLFTLNITAQNIETNFSKNINGKFCGEEKFRFELGNGKLIRTDLYYNTQEEYKAKRDDSTFDDFGNYIEYWSPKYYFDLTDYDIYEAMKKNYYRIAYDKKGGNVLYILEIKQIGKSLDIDNAKYYFTQLGYEKFCN